MFNIEEQKKRQKNIYNLLKSQYSDTLLFDYSMYYKIFLYCFNKKGLFNNHVKYNKKINSIAKNFNYYETTEFSTFLENLYSNINLSFYSLKIENCKLKQINISLNEMLELSKSFYQKLDNELYELANKTLDNFNLIQICEKFYDNKHYCNGLSFFDFTNHLTYIAINKTYTLNDVQAFNHEVMHAIDFYIQPKYFNEYNYYFIEIITYTIDYLFLDYLEENNYYIDEVKKLKLNKMKSIYNLLNIISIYKENYNIYKKNELKKIYLESILELESTVIAHLMYEKRYDSNFIEQLKKLSKKIILKSEKPDFNFLGIDDQMILNKSKTYVIEYLEKNNF